MSAVHFFLLLFISVVTVTSIKSQTNLSNKLQNVKTQKSNQPSHTVQPNGNTIKANRTENLSKNSGVNYKSSSVYNNSLVFNKIAHSNQTNTKKPTIPKYANISQKNGTTLFRDMALVKIFKLGSTTGKNQSDNSKLTVKKVPDDTITSRENENGLYFQETLNPKLHVAVISNKIVTKPRQSQHEQVSLSRSKPEDVKLNTSLGKERQDKIIDYGDFPTFDHGHHDYDVEGHTPAVLDSHNSTPQDDSQKRPTRDTVPVPPPPSSANPKNDVNSEFNWLATGKPLRTTLRPTSGNTEDERPGAISVIEWRWPEVGIFFAFAAFVVATGIFRAAFHRSHFLLTHVPESCLMIVLGAFVGAILFACGVEAPGDHAEGPAVIGQGNRQPGSPVTTSVSLPVLSPRLFFNVLIPPVILESAYTLYDRAVMANIYPILLHSIVGKFLNAISLAAAMLLVERNGLMGSLARYGEPLTSNYTLSVQDTLLYSAIASGVDSAAVLPIFEENGINKDLFFVLLGESLLNDAVTVTMSEYTAKLAEALTFERGQYGKATLFLVAVSLGGLAFGIVGGLLSALVTRTTHHCAAVEPLALLGLAYMSYISAELIQFSGHICIMGCGLVQAHYAFKNISHTSYNTVKDLTKMISSTSEAVIFLFLGMVLVSKNHSWHTGFVAWTIVLCLACRIVVVVLLCSIHTALGGRFMEPKDQIVLSYCGLRGAVCFCLAHMANPLSVAPRPLFITSLLALIIFTTFVQGGTAKYLIDLLHIERQHWGHDKGVVEELHDQILSIATSGVEEIIGPAPSMSFPIYKKMKEFDEKYLSKIFLRQHEGANMSHLFNEYSQSYNLALLQHQLFLAIRDAHHDKKHSKILMVMPTIFSNLVRKMGPQILPMVYFGDDGKQHNGRTFRHIVAPKINGSLIEIPIKEEEEEQVEQVEDEEEEIIKNILNQSNGSELKHVEQKDHLIIEDVEAHDLENKEPPPLLPSNENQQQQPVVMNHALSDLQDDVPPPLKNRKSNFIAVPSVIKRAINRVIQPPPPSTNRAEIRPVNPSIEIPNNVPDKNELQINKTLDVINENKPLDTTRIVSSKPDQAGAEKLQADNLHPTNGHELHTPADNATDVSQEFPTFVLTRNTSKDDGSEPRDISQSELTSPESHALDQVQHRDSFDERIPQIPPIINLVGPSPESSSRRIFNAPSSPLKNRSKRMSGRKIPLFRPSVNDPPYSALRHRRVSLNNRPHSSQQDKDLNATAQSLRRAVLDSPYRRMRYHGRHRELEADYERLTQAVLSRHLQMIDDELQLVADVVTRCHSTIDQLRSGNLSRATRPVSEPSNDHARELAARLIAADDTSSGRAGFQNRRKAPATAPQTALKSAVHNEWRKMFADAPRPRVLTARTLRRNESKIESDTRHHQAPHARHSSAGEHNRGHQVNNNQHRPAANYKNDSEAYGHVMSPLRVNHVIVQEENHPHHVREHVTSPHYGQAVNHRHGPATNHPEAYGHVASPHHSQGTHHANEHVTRPQYGQHVGNHVQYASVQIHNPHLTPPSNHVVNFPVTTSLDQNVHPHAPRRFSSSNNPPYVHQLTPPNLPPRQPQINLPYPNQDHWGYRPAFLAQVVRPDFVPNPQFAGPRIPWYTTRHPFWQREPTGTLILPLSRPPEPPRTLGAPQILLNDTRESWERPRHSRPAKRRPHLSERPPWK